MVRVLLVAPVMLVPWHCQEKLTGPLPVAATEKLALLPAGTD